MRFASRSSRSTRRPAGLTLLGLTLLGLALLVGCHRSYVAPETPLPANTVLLSQMLRSFTTQHPDATEHFLAALDAGGKRGPALLTPRLIDELRKRIVGKDWSGLDRFPGWTMRELDPAVTVAEKVAGKDTKLEAASEVHPGAPIDGKTARAFLDLGPYALEQSQTISLDTPSTFAPFDAAAAQTQLSAGLVRGDGPNELAPEHAASEQLADILNRLAANELDGVAKFSASIEQQPITAPYQLIAALAATGHTVTVTDSRYFANFTHLHYNGQDVMAPFWVDTKIVIPNSGGRHLVVPVSHAELEWHIRGPKVNADVSWYFGVDGKADWRTMDTLDQAWVLHRDAHTYTRGQAVEVTRLATRFTVAYMHAHTAHPQLPFGGYYELGVCQDAVAAVERKMIGATTLFPNTADATYFNDPRDLEVNAMMRTLPHDRDSATPDPARIFGSLPAEPGADGSFAAVTIPGLAADLSATYAAWKDGTLQQTHSTRNIMLVTLAIGFVLVLLRRRRRRG
jgi:hypothetical protein